jgi:tetratricopeptide (TPR) repeat protein
LKTKLKELAPETQAAIWEGFKNHYRGLASYYHNLLNSKNPQEKQWGILFCRWEYENLFNALQIALNQQESVLSIITCLHSYLDLNQDTQTNLKLLEFVLETFENYPPEAKQGQMALEIIAIIVEAGSKYLQSKNYQKAKEIYQKSLELLKPISESYSQSKQSLQASTLHNLGRVAQELREWEQARSYYRQALEIKIEYGARYEQASTLHCLGIVAQEVGELSQAKSYYLQALQILAEFNDNYTIQTFSLPRLVALYQQTQDEEILVGIASVLGIGVEEVRGLLEG